MELDELIRTITSQVLEQLRRPADLARVLVLAEPDSELKQALARQLGSEVDLCFLGATEQGDGISRCILPSLCLTDMADLACGRAQGPVMEEVLRLLLSGQEVEVLSYEYHRYQDTAPGPLYALYRDQAERLVAFGCKPFVAAQPEVVRLWQHLITQAMVLEAATRQASVLQVPTNAQVTPLAAETARDATITIVKSL
jgi:hypothetical protein